MADPSADDVGFWRALRDLGKRPFGEVVWPEGVLGLIVGGGGGYLVVKNTSIGDRLAITGDLVAVGAALLAVVFAALAIVVALPTSRYLGVLATNETGGIRPFLDSFLVAAGTQIAIILSALGLGLVGETIGATVSDVAFCALGALFAFGLFDVLALARQLVRHGIGRSIEAIDELPPGERGAVEDLDARRGKQPGL